MVFATPSMVVAVAAGKMSLVGIMLEWKLTTLAKMGLLSIFLFRLVTRELSIAALNDDEGEMVVFFFSVLIVPGGGGVKIPLPPGGVLIACWIDCNVLRHLLLSRCRNYHHDKGSNSYYNTDYKS